MPVLSGTVIRVLPTMCGFNTHNGGHEMEVVVVQVVNDVDLKGIALHGAL